MPEEEDVDDYSYEKSEFLDRVSSFIKSYIKMPILDVIVQLEELITTYEQSFIENDDDKDYIKDLKTCLELYEDAQRQQQILQTPISAQEKKEIKKDALTLQFNYETSLWRKLFNLNSYHNDLYGQALFHVTLGVICDIKIPYLNDFIWARPSLFYIQRSRSGKNKGMRFVEKTLLPLKKNNRPIIVVQGGKQNDPTLLDRYVMEMTKGGIMRIKKDDDGEPLVLPGLLTRVDLFWYPEADFLLNPISKDNMEAINIHLNLLEAGGKYRKELTQWSGLYTDTQGGHYSLVCLSRPIENIKKYLIFSGLLQRHIFIPRQLSLEDRKIMRNFAALNAHKTTEEIEQYKKDFNLLIQELQNIQKFAKTSVLRIRDENSEKFRSELNKKLEAISDYVSQQLLSETNQQIIEDFIGNYTDHLLMFSFQAALVRHSEDVELVDLEYSSNFLNACLHCFIPWLEEAIIPTRDEVERQARKQNIMVTITNQNKNTTCKMAQIIKTVMHAVKCSYPTARKIVFDYSQEPYNLYKIDVDAKIVQF